MGKRNKKLEIVLKDEELTPTTIGFLEDEKKSSLILVLFFVIFVLFAVFLPDITNYVNKLLGKDQDIIVTPTKEETEKPEEEQNDIKMYDLSDTLEFTYNDIVFSSFKKYQMEESYYLAIKLTNNSKKTIDFSKDKYYIELYSQEKTLLGRYIFSNIQLSTNSTNSQIISLTEDEYNNFSKLVITLKTEKDYPEIVLTEDENKQPNLKCNRIGNTINYTFDKQNNLIRIKDTINYPNDNSDSYKQTLSLYQSQVANYNTKKGVSSSLVEISTGFTVTTDISISTANIKELANDNYYSNDTNPKVIKFEMESRGYSCN